MQFLLMHLIFISNMIFLVKYSECKLNFKLQIEFLHTTYKSLFCIHEFFIILALKQN